MIVGESIELPTKVRRRNETTITRKAIVVLNRIPGVVATRNNVGVSPVACTYCRAHLCQRCRPRLTYPIPFGLAIGSSDIVGCYTAIVTDLAGHETPWPLFFGVEIKAPGSTTKRDHLEDQERWMRVMDLRGMPCTMATSSEEATAKVHAMIDRWTTRLEAFLVPRASISPLDTRAWRGLVSQSRSIASSSSPRRTTRSSKRRGACTAT